MQNGFAVELYIVLCSTYLLIIRVCWDFACGRSNTSKQGASDMLCEGTHGYFPVACSFLLVYTEQKYHFIRPGSPRTMGGI